ncbi:MAG: haloacid dehalogenase type II [Chloroflexota bacterium]|nr:haloacid dehalogenase type II [Chloroflexota bacterium]
MAHASVARVRYLTFDIFGTVMNLTGSLAPPAGEFLAALGSEMTGEAFYTQWRARQRIEQYQDNLLMLGHSGYLETCRRAFVYCLRMNAVSYTDDAVRDFMHVYRNLQPYEDAIEGLRSLAERYQLVALSNGEQWYLEELLRNNVPIEFDAIISVEQAGAFKPSPGIYRKAIQQLECEPGEIMMVAAHAFDILGAQACGFKAAYVDRYSLPTEVSDYQPDIIVNDFVELADSLLT